MKTTNISFRKAALPVFGVLLAAIIALTSVTYAWFTSGTTATVQPINVGVEAAGGLQFAMNSGDDVAFEWKSSLDLSTIIGDVTLTPASSDGTTTGDNGARSLTFLAARYNDTFDKISDIASIDNSSSDRAGYITFDLYFRNPELTAKNINLTDTTVTSLAGQSNQAVRIAFVRQSKISSASSTQTPNAFVSAETKYNDAVKIFEPNATVHTSNGITDYAKNTAQTEGAVGNIKHDYKAVVGTGSANVMYDRFTGKSYTAETSSRTFNAEANYSTKLVFDSSQNIKFDNWEMDDDFTEITPQEAATQKVDGKKIYVKNEGVYAEQSGEIQPSGVKYYLFTPVKLYTEADSNVLSATNVATVTDTSTTFFSLEAQSITKVTIYIWLEGQDTDCNNTVAGYQFDANLSFASVTVA